MTEIPEEAKLTPDEIKAELRKTKPEEVVQMFWGDYRFVADAASEKAFNYFREHCVELDDDQNLPENPYDINDDFDGNVAYGESQQDMLNAGFRKIKPE